MHKNGHTPNIKQLARAWVVVNLDELKREREKTTGNGRGVDADFAKALGIAAPRVSEIRKGTRQVQLGELSLASQFFGKPLPEQLTRQVLSGKLIPLKGTVLADKWIELADVGRRTEDVAVWLPDEIPLADLFGMKVEGLAMDLLYPPGTLLVCAPLTTDEELVEGRRYIVERYRADGRIEITAKEAARDRSGAWWLWPKSSQPEYQVPIPAAGTPEYRVKVAARVIRSSRPEP